MDIKQEIEKTKQEMQNLGSELKFLEQTIQEKMVNLTKKQGRLELLQEMQKKELEDKKE